MMEIKLNGIKYSKKFNLGNYESEDISVDASVESGSPSDCLRAMMEFVGSKGKTQWPSKGVPEKAVVKAAESEKVIPAQLELKPIETPAPAKAEKVKPVAAPKKVIQKDVPAFSESAELRAQAKMGDAIPKKATAYDRATDLHKKLVSELLDINFPQWRANPSKAKEVSTKLEGKPFLDNEGIILKSFKDEFTAAMKS